MSHLLPIGIARNLSWALLGPKWPRCKLPERGSERKINKFDALLDFFGIVPSVPGYPYAVTSWHRLVTKFSGLTPLGG